MNKTLDVLKVSKVFPIVTSIFALFSELGYNNDYVFIEILDLKNSV